jgi:pteridine reductase
MQLNGKVILITGGAVRVGRTICQTLVETGARIYCHFNQSETAARQLQHKNPDIQLIQADLYTSGAGRRMIQQIIEMTGRIDVLVNSAAVFIKTPLGQVDETGWHQLFDLNLKAPFFLAQEVGKYMQKQGAGKIINIADTSGLKPWPSYIPYSMTKAALINMTKGLARALAPNIQVNGINPGPVLLPDGYTEQERQKAIERTLLKREGRPEDVANAVKFLLEDGDYITGTILAVDGGRSIL